MKKIVICFILTTFFITSYPQSLTKKEDKRELNVGDYMPDILLGTVVDNEGRKSNSYMNKTHFSDFKGKLIILDFWDSFCSTCIEGFPKMSELQKKFKDQIQIFLVNPIENEEQIMNRLLKFEKKELKDIIPSNLPIIAEAKKLFQFFPTKGEIGYHVWIDSNRIVKLRGIYLNTNEEKIRDILAGKKIDFIRDGNRFDKQVPLFAKVNNTTSTILQYNSLFTMYTDELGDPWGGGYVLNLADSASGTIRTTFANTTILDLYKISTNTIMKDERIIWGKRILLFVNDTIQYTDDRSFYSEPKTDKTHRKSRFCYEQITPINLSEHSRFAFMLEDLNRYFGIKYMVTGKVEKRNMPCYLLVRTSESDKIKSKGKETDRGYDGIVVINGREMLSSINLPLRQIINRLIDDGGNKVLGVNDILIDETEYKQNVDIILPYAFNGRLKSLDELRKALQVYDLDIIKGEREFVMLVIKEEQFKN